MPHSQFDTQSCGLTSLRNRHMGDVCVHALHNEHGADATTAVPRRTAAILSTAVSATSAANPRRSASTVPTEASAHGANSDDWWPWSWQDHALAGAAGARLHHRRR